MAPAATATVPTTEIKTKYSSLTRNDFPPDFVFGTGTAAYQHEGGATKGGRGLSVWDVFTMRTPGRITDGSNGIQAIDMYTRYKEDIKMMKNMGFDAYRFSISWSRILPGGKISLGINKEGIDYYNDVINTVISHGMKPYITLFHWDLPFTLEQEYGGFLSPNIVEDFREFADVCFWEFGDRVKHWFTLNEPWSYCNRGYVENNTPPGKNFTGTFPADGSAPAPAPAPAPATATARSATVGDAAKLADITRNLLALSNSPSNSIEKIQDICNRAINKSKKSFNNYRCHNYIVPNHVQTTTTTTTITITKKTLIFSNDSTTHDHHDDESMSDIHKEAFIAAKYMCLAHAAVVELYNNKYRHHQKGNMGITLVSSWFEPLNADSQADVDAARRALDFMLGWFMDPILAGRWPETMEGYVPEEAQFSRAESEMLLANKIDILGLNYYTARYVQDNQNPDPTLHPFNKYQYLDLLEEKDGIPIGEAPGASWLLIVPWGIKSLLKRVNELYSSYGIPPVYITENGLADVDRTWNTPSTALVDPRRVEYFRDHLGNLLDAMKELDGTDGGPKLQIKGYFAWSWADNFEWTDGYTMRFGLIYIDFKNNLKRHPKHSALWFSKFLVKHQAAETSSPPVEDELDTANCKNN